MKIFVLTVLFLSTHSAWAGVWSLSVKPELVDAKDQVKKSVLRFTSRTGLERVYTPPAYPWGYYDSKEVILNGKTHFITFWSAGARSVHFRIFQPDQSAQPVCEFLSESEKPDVRYKNQKLQYLETTFNENNKKISLWRNCPVKDIPEKTPASVPLKKSLKKLKKPASQK